MSLFILQTVQKFAETAGDALREDSLTKTTKPFYLYDAGCGSVKKQNTSASRKQETKHVYF